MAGRKHETIELFGQITTDNLNIWKEEAEEAEKGRYTLLVFKYPRRVKPTYLEKAFEVMQAILKKKRK